MLNLLLLPEIFGTIWTYTCYPSYPKIWSPPFDFLAASLNPSPAERICPAFTNNVDPDHLASEEANWSGSALFVIQYMK